MIIYGTLDKNNNPRILISEQMLTNNLRENGQDR